MIKRGKAKTTKAVKNRFKVTKNGKVLYRSQNLRHHRGQKSSGQLRRLKTVKNLFKTMAKKIKKVLHRS